jgi:hypothetical protein
MFSKGKPKNGRVHEYLLAPNFDLVPPPDGPLKLGHILDDPDEPRYPLNIDSVVTPLDSQSYEHTASGVSAVRSQLANKEFKLWARLTELVPIGGDGALAKDASSSDLFTIKTIETTYFLPSSKYVEASVNGSEDVRRFLAGGGLWDNNDIYMITGLKVARNGSVTSYVSDGRKASAGASADLKDVGVPFTAGAGGEKVVASEEATHIAELKPFVLAYQVRKIVYKKGKPAKTVAHNLGGMFSNDRPIGNTDDLFVVDGVEDGDTVPDSVRNGGSWVTLSPATDGEGEGEDENQGGRVWISV